MKDVSMKTASTPSAQPHISIVVPFYNEGPGVELFAAAMKQLVVALPDYRVELICVDDGSSDDTLGRLIALAEHDGNYTVIGLSRNFGKEAAMTAGLDAARGDAVITMDADLQDPPELVVLMLRAWHQGADVVLARRATRDCDTPLKRLTAKWFYRVHNMVSDISIPQNVGDFRLMDRKVVRALSRLPERQRFMKGLFCWVGFKTVTVDYHRPARSIGTTKFAGWKLWNLALEGITSFSTAPLRIWTYVGLATASVTSLYALIVLVRTMVWGISVPGYASLLIVVLFLGSLQLISLGLIGEYIGRIYVESKQRPVYIVRSQHGGESPRPTPSSLMVRRQHGQHLAWGLPRGRASAARAKH
jgi:glycosyltransferase involved in cell wall biosynthesis